VQAAFAEKVAVTVHPAPFAVNPPKLYACGDANGALKVWVPPHDPVIVNVPLDGGLENEMLPLNEY
jgi:hypothetical protein